MLHTWGYPGAAAAYATTRMRILLLRLDDLSLDAAAVGAWSQLRVYPTTSRALNSGEHHWSLSLPRGARPEENDTFVS